MINSKVLLILFCLLISLIAPISGSIQPVSGATQASRTISFSGSIRLPTALTKLTVEGNVIRNSGGPIFLLGVNVRSQANNPKTDGRYDDWYTYRQKDAANIQSFGCNTIRLLVYWEALETSTSPTQFTYSDSYIALIEETVRAYNEKGIYVILDLHTHAAVNELNKFVPTAGNDFDFQDAFYSDLSTTSAREHLAKVWLKLSEHFGNWPGVAGYELLNEPHRSSGLLTNQQVADLWFNMADFVIDSLRTRGDDHIAIVDFAPWARSATFMSRTLNDSNVVYAPHFYYGIDEANLVATNSNYQWLKEQFDLNINQKMLQFNVPFIMGEQGFGSHQLVAGDPQYVWLQNAYAIHKTNPNMQGWIYFCYIAYGGTPIGGGWQDIL